MKKSLIPLLIVLFALIILPSDREINKSFANVEMGNYCYAPPSIATTVPPLVMLVMGRDHKLYYEAYNDASDLDGDGRLDVGYKHSIDYYGYFDPYKCYSYSGSGANAKFVPVSTTSNKYCSGQWSGNFLNWLTMSRMDVLKKVLYGGDRITDSASETVLEASYIPQDAHSWGKEYAGSDTPQLTPFSVPSSGTRHLFCVTSTSAGDTRRIRVLLSKSNRIWEWASKERPVCDNSLGTPSEYTIKVQVCNSSVGLEPNCKRYPQGTYKPIGLLQKYGEYEGGGKWCSKSLKSCNTDSDCNIATDGLCLDRAKMYFGFLTGSYTKNLSGGVLRKNIWTIQDEINAQTGYFQTSENVPGNIILTIDRMRVVGFDYNNYAYGPWTWGDYGAGHCGWLTNRPINEGECRMWGNPIGEMMYEALRYLAGKGTPTSSFTYSGTQDSGLNLSKPDWGIQKGSDRYQPYQLFPICAKPFMIVLSDINPSYDSDSLPGSSFGGITGDLTGLDVSTLAETISSGEGISGDYFIGQIGSLYDFICSPKNVTGFSNIRGLCPEEPTKQGSYYSASIAYYGNTAFKDNFTGTKPFNVKTYSVALASPIPDIAIKVGNNTVRISPFAKSVSGCLDVYQNCAQKCKLTRDTNGRLIISDCQANAFCPTNQIVDFYVEELTYDSNNNLTYARFNINFEDVEQGADHDMDAIVKYEITPVGYNQIRVRLTSDFAAGCLDQVLGFFISGTTEDGQWLVLKDRDVSVEDGDTPEVVANMPGSPTTSPGGITYWERTFTLSGSAGGQLKNPLWYAAKWGGFDDQNGNNRPDLQSEWDKDGDGIPDTYFYVVNPLKMEQELEKAFADILRKASSGATVATLSSRTEVSSLVIQPYFYPVYQTEDGREISWIGIVRSFWIDFKGRFHEDSIINKILDLAASALDNIIQFMTVENETKIAVLQGEQCSLGSIKNIDDINTLFNSGCKLALADQSSRKIYFNKNGNLADFNTSEATTIRGFWQSIDSNINNDTKAGCIIRYIIGENVAGDSNCQALTYVKRPREFNIQPLCGVNQEKTWKLGDIIHSTPSVTSNQPNNFYHVRYSDDTYRQYISSSNYKNRISVAFVSANDGALHAFRIGTIVEQSNASQPAKLQDSPSDSATNKLGQEEWAFIPRNAIPYLLWYGRIDYCHVPTVDYRTIVFDASINGDASDNKTSGSWRTILVGVMGFGGKSLTAGSTTYSSSIFALDLTGWLNGSDTKPTLLWEITLPDNTLTLSFPTIVRLGDRNKNGEWYVVLGSGPSDVINYSFVSSPKLHFINLRNGSIVKTLNVSLPANTSSAIGDVWNVDVDNDYQDDVIYFGAYGTSGSNVWGNFYRLSLRNGNSYRSISILGDTDIKVAVDLSTFKTDNNQPPVFAAPAFTIDDTGNFWVFFGTGRYLNISDKNITYTNYLIGFKDPCWNGSCSTTLRKSDLVDYKAIMTTTTSPYQSFTECVCEEGQCQNKTMTYNKSTLNIQQDIAPQYGWYYTLNSKEAIVSQPFVYAEFVNNLVLIPPADICEFSGFTRYIALYYKLNMGGKTTVVFDNPAKKYFGTPPIGQAFEVHGSGKLLTQLSSGLIPGDIFQPNPSARGRFISWIEK